VTEAKVDPSGRNWKDEIDDFFPCYCGECDPVGDDIIQADLRPGSVPSITGLGTQRPPEEGRYRASDAADATAYAAAAYDALICSLWDQPPVIRAEDLPPSSAFRSPPTIRATFPFNPFK
jgi:hypothetical protein